MTDPLLDPLHLNDLKPAGPMMQRCRNPCLRTFTVGTKSPSARSGRVEDPVRPMWAFKVLSNLETLLCLRRSLRTTNNINTSRPRNPIVSKGSLEVYESTDRHHLRPISCPVVLVTFQWIPQAIGIVLPNSSSNISGHNRLMPLPWRKPRQVRSRA